MPAAQLLQEELAKKKREEMKTLAIQQYQMFLKKYYAGKGAIINPLPKQGVASSVQDPSQFPSTGLSSNA